MSWFFFLPPDFRIDVGRWFSSLQTVQNDTKWIPNQMQVYAKRNIKRWKLCEYHFLIPNEQCVYGEEERSAEPNKTCNRRCFFRSATFTFFACIGCHSKYRQSWLHLCWGTSIHMLRSHSTATGMDAFSRFLLHFNSRFSILCSIATIPSLCLSIAKQMLSNIYTHFSTFFVAPVCW